VRHAGLWRENSSASFAGGSPLHATPATVALRARLRAGWRTPKAQILIYAMGVNTAGETLANDTACTPGWDGLYFSLAPLPPIYDILLATVQICCQYHLRTLYRHHLTPSTHGGVIPPATSMRRARTSMPSCLSMEEGGGEEGLHSWPSHPPLVLISPFICWQACWIYRSMPPWALWIGRQQAYKNWAWLPVLSNGRAGGAATPAEQATNIYYRRAQATARAQRDMRTRTLYVREPAWREDWRAGRRTSFTCNAFHWRRLSAWFAISCRACWAGRGARHCHSTICNL